MQKIFAEGEGISVIIPVTVFHKTGAKKA